MATRNFLQDYQNVLLRHVIMPGSHDAGLARESYGSLGMIGSGESMTVTQTVGVGDQAIRGSRFFDVRIISSGGQLKAYHSPKDTRLVGGVGQAFETILDELQGFVRSNPSEFVIIRLSHIKNSTEVFAALMGWMEKSALYGKKNGDYVYKGAGNLAQKFVHELAGKMIFVVDGAKLTSAKFPGRVAPPGQADGFHKLYQNKKSKPLPTVNDGLCMCGEFANSNKLEKIVAGQTASYTQHAKHRTHGDDKSHLYCLYWTSTGGNIEKNTREQLSKNFQIVRNMVAESNANTAKYCLDNNVPLVNTKAWSNAIAIEDRARQRYAVYSCSLPNIILYDFVNTETSEEIIGLNGLVLCQT
ncbi:MULTISPECIES: PI-PLC domain-containing protein [Rhodanobacter]|uniref:Phosphatidylinositol diacylglycerol-lyase n=1 Tax=Rhodanobacter hydrolyticus TaxID=2250595 RepID=A0ABW8JAN3_9GAMM|nr:hypothetical protein [Rhodanobacter sp. 7MK24]MBD8880160.1 hypothetical protein [Rhodanobacter sp. 7MK24]